jgi:hypothetical protein
MRRFPSAVAQARQIPSLSVWRVAAAGALAAMPLPGAKQASMFDAIN